MKIVTVTLRYSYGREELGPDFIAIDGFEKSFRALGHEVVPFYYDAYLTRKDALQQEFLRFVETQKPDLLFFSLYTDEFAIATLDELKRRFTTVVWFGDDYWRFEAHTSVYAPHFTYCVTTDKYSLAKYRAIGQNNVIASHWAAVDQHPIPPHGEYRYDVSFVGGFSEYRRWVMDELQRHGISVHVFGRGWPSGHIDAADMNACFASSKINLNISNSSTHDIRYAFFRQKSWRRKLKDYVYLMLSRKLFVSDLRTPKYISSVKARNFEIPYFGGFQIAEYAPSIEDYFIVGREIVCFRELGELEMLIRYYLERDDERESIRSAGHQRAVAEHSYRHRLHSLLEQIA